ncbi:MAG: hypothetical protein V4538_15420 [Bacteroidota bacterium]
MKYLIILSVLFSACKKVDIQPTGHQCKWHLCPYKGITPANYGKAVSNYVGNSESVGYSLDILHLNFPNAEYEELESMLNED